MLGRGRSTSTRERSRVCRVLLSRRPNRRRKSRERADDDAAAAGSALSQAPASDATRTSRIAAEDSQVLPGSAPPPKAQDAAGDLAGAIEAPFRGGPFSGAKSDRTVWALRTSASSAPGETSSDHRRNGAGKSTLLKVLSRITEASRPRADHGRVGACSRSNRASIRLTGARTSLERRDPGMPPRGDPGKFEQIVASRRSRGSSRPRQAFTLRDVLRLAFASPRTWSRRSFSYDEVLAVGDLPFQKKCLGKMEGGFPARPHGPLRQPQHGACARSARRLVLDEAASRPRRYRRCIEAYFKQHRRVPVRGRGPATARVSFGRA